MPVIETASPIRWHRPLLCLAAAAGLLAAYALVARFIDAQLVTGVNQWDKPLKFAISTVIYTVTWSWLIGQLRRWQRTASIAGTVITITFTLELVIIVAAAAWGTTSHFNVSTPLHTAMWSTMGISIAVLWVANLIVALILFGNALGDRARATAIRLGALISLVGLGLAFLMTAPTGQQLDDFQGIAGAHTVGIADGGPGLPLLGWSTIGGDLRIPHFVGMHALQALPIALIGIELLSRRVVPLQNVASRTAAMWVIALAYLGLVLIVTWQALRGQSIVHPDALTLGSAAGLVVLSAASMGVVLMRGRVRESTGEPRQASDERPSLAES